MEVGEEGRYTVTTTEKKKRKKEKTPALKWAAMRASLMFH